MKYLKRFNESMDHKEIKATLDDILLELSDEGFDIHCNVGWSVGTTSFEIRVDRNGTSFKWEDISETMNRIYNYLSSLGEKISLGFFNENDEFFRISDRLEYDTLERWFRSYYHKETNDLIIYFDLGEGDPYIDYHIKK